MYEAFYGLKARPFQLNPDPSYFYSSKGHSRAMSYLEYGVHQGEGFIVITGEIGAGKTTLVRNLFRKLENLNLVAAQLVSTQLDADDMLQIVAAAFGADEPGASKATLLKKLEAFLLSVHRQGKRALLVVDEAQNLTPKAVEELRMLSNFQAGERSLLQSFLLGQPEFRYTLQSEGMQQLRQRVMAAYHLGPMDSTETRAYIEHRLKTAEWTNDPTFSTDAFAAIFEFAGGIPRKINMLCDRLLLMGYLEELHQLDAKSVREVVEELKREFALPAATSAQAPMPATAATAAASGAAAIASPAVAEEVRRLEDKVTHMEHSISSVLKIMREVLTLSSGRPS
jgi:general secretion pathway protein A